MELIDDKTIEDVCAKVRLKCIEMVERTKTGHIASAFSMLDILITLAFDQFQMDNPPVHMKNKLIISKGHGALSYYAALGVMGIVPEELLERYLVNGSNLHAFPFGRYPYLEFSSGSLGHGLSNACGIAYALKIKREKGRVFTILSDGECQTGSTWEAFQFAAHHALENIVVIVDSNKIQATERVKEVIRDDGFLPALEAYGFNIIRVDGHDIPQLRSAFQSSNLNKPTIIWADTIKGKGVSFMEDRVEWHYLPINKQQAYLAKQEILGRLNEKGAC
jgi:transketolase